MKYLDIIFFKTWADLKAEASRAYIGFLWWFIEPILYMATFYLLFGLGLRYGGDNFVYFLLCGLIPWKWFSSTVANGSRSIEANGGLILQVYLPKHILPAITVLINTAKFSIIFLLLLVFLSISGFSPTLAWVVLPILILVQFLLVLTTTSLLAAMVPFVPDIKFVIENTLLLLMFLSGIFFDIEKFSPNIKAILYLNPVALLVKNYRLVLLEQQWPEASDLMYVVGISLLFGILAYYILSKFNRRYAKVV